MTISDDVAVLVDHSMMDMVCVVNPWVRLGKIGLAQHPAGRVRSKCVKLTHHIYPWE